MLIRNDWSVRQLEQKVQALNRGRKEKAAEEALPDLFYSLAERVGRHFDGNVAVRRDAKGGGTITIRFNNDNQVQEFLDDLNR